ncbi:BTAD domain-containing putative transcriptional regulator [Actinoplanes sp. NPDC026670]|uniref:AfsR/SARP family transcriptional regulator n=1 Tax=Actinoplanes sp. NPDC026670 TaxID=3154700 RepID=UPI003402D326
MLVRLLGPFEVDGEDGPIVLAGASQRVILAALALSAGRPVALSALVDALWPESPPASARNSLQSHVARLRSRLAAPGRITLVPAGYCLDLPRSHVDALHLEDLARDPSGAAEAVTLWRGDPLPEFPGEPFRSAAARLTSLYRTVLVHHATSLDAVSAVTALQPAADVDPCWEDGAVALATALTAAGRRGDALEVLRRHSDAVIDRLGLDPSARVRQTQLTILRPPLPDSTPPAIPLPAAVPPSGPPAIFPPVAASSSAPPAGPLSAAAPSSAPPAMPLPAAASSSVPPAGPLSAAGPSAAPAAPVAPFSDRTVAVGPLPASVPPATALPAPVLPYAPLPASAVPVVPFFDRTAPVVPLPGLVTSPAALAGPSPRAAAGSGVPLRFSSFLGRAEEQQRLAALLAVPGLVSVVGPGGVGKTRLVAETVRAAAGVAWVDAAGVREEDLVEALAVGVGARVTPNDDPFTVIAAAAARHRIVVLDNCEHVLATAAGLAAALRGVRLVVTSQESLRVDGEQVLRLGPLSVDSGRRLFCERAGAPQSEMVGEIVDRLDLLPLAIELAATQAAALGVAELHARLDDRLDLLNRGSRGADPRHRTLRAVVAWSFGLLDEPSAGLLRRLAVFAGTFTVAAAEAVAAAEVAGAGAVAGAGGVGGVADLPRAQVAALLAGLVDRSLVVRDGPGRFRLLETVRAYASENPGADRAVTEARHAEAMTAAAVDLDRRMRGPDQAAAVREFDGLLPDLRLAFARGRPAVRVRLAAAMYRYGYRCQQYEVLAWGRAALAGPPHPDAFAAAATHAWGRGDLAEARDLAGRAEPPGAPAHEVLGDVALVACEAETALAHYRAMGGDPVHRVSGLVGEALVLAWSGRVTEATAAAGEAVVLADATGNPSARAEARYGLGEALGDTDPVRALALLAEAVELAVPVDDRLFQAAAGTAAVAVRSRHGEPGPALAEFREVLRLWRRAGNDTLHTAALRNLLVLLARVGADEAAAQLDGALPEAAMYPAEAARLRRAREAVAERLGPERVAALRRHGELLGPARATEAAARAIDVALAQGCG